MANYTTTAYAANTAAEDETRGCEKCFCFNLVLSFFGVLLALTLGLLIGALFAPVIYCALAAIIVFAVVLVVLIISLLIYRRCRCSRREDRNCGCR